jgi:DNA-binding response OmpR family regulator
LVVRLELPDAGESFRAVPDLHRLATAVQDLVRAVAPTVVTRVCVAEPEPNPLPEPNIPNGSNLSMAVNPSARQPAPAVDLELDLGSRTLVVDGTVVVLTRREFDLLAYLQRRRGVAMSRRELMNAVWQSGYLAGDRTVDVHIRRLRVKLGPHAARLSTLRGYGYRFD